MIPCDGLYAGMALTAECPTCGHAVALHTWPGRLCAACIDGDRWGDVTKLERRVARLERRLRKAQRA